MIGALTWKGWLGVLWRLAIAATLLVIEVRLFLLYAFIFLLTVQKQIDYLRALVRVTTSADNVRFILLMRGAGISEEDVHTFVDGIASGVAPQFQEDFSRDMRLVGVAPRGEEGSYWLARYVGDKLASPTTSAESK